MNELNEFKELKEQFESATKSLKEQLRERGVEIFMPHFQGLFNKYPKLESFRWHQYRPYFNDGDVCEFGIQGVYSKFEGILDGGGDYGDGFEDAWSFKYQIAKEANPDAKDYPANEFSLAAKEVESFINSLEEECELAFGDSSTITVTRETILVEECDHE